MSAIGDWLYAFFGVSGVGPHYAFWSGPGSDISEVAIVGGILSWWHHKNCHVKGCFRLGKHQVEGTPHVVCRKHHPDDAPTAQQIIIEHRKACDAQEAQGSQQETQVPRQAQIGVTG